MVRNRILLKDEKSHVIFNQHSFRKLVKRLLVELIPTKITNQDGIIREVIE